GEPLTADPVAYELFLQARRAMNTEAGDSPTMFARIVALLNAAVARDPGFARAYTELARWHALTHLHGYDRSPARAALARAAAAARWTPGAPRAMTVRVVGPSSRFLETGDVAAFREGVSLYPPGVDDAEGIAVLERFRLALLERDVPAAGRALAASAATRFRM